MNNNRIESLDSLRGIASLVVVIFHCLLSFTIFYEANYNFNFSNGFLEFFTVTPIHTLWAGKEAVLLFFVLSGFVLMIPFTINRQSSYLTYLIKRVCRIYVPYLIVMTISVILAYFFWQYNTAEGLSSTYENRWNHEVSLKAIIAYIGMLNFDTANVNGVVWTLFIEMKISLILPIFLIIISKLEWKKGFLLALGLNTILYIGVGYGLKNVDFLPIRALCLFFSGTLYYNYFFILGAILAKQRSGFQNISYLSDAIKYMILGISLILINSRWVEYFVSFQVENIENLIAGIGFALLFFVVLTTKSVDEFLNNRILKYLGKVSFSLYLVHIPVLMLTTVFLSRYIPIWFSFCLVPFFSILVAHISYMWIEEPSMKLGKRIAQKVSRAKLKDKALNV